MKGSNPEPREMQKKSNGEQEMPSSLEVCKTELNRNRNRSQTEPYGFGSVLALGWLSVLLQKTCRKDEKRDISGYDIVIKMKFCVHKVKLLWKNSETLFFRIIDFIYLKWLIHFWKFAENDDFSMSLRERPIFGASGKIKISMYFQKKWYSMGLYMTK